MIAPLLEIQNSRGRRVPKSRDLLKNENGFFQKGVEFSEPTKGVFLYTLKRGKGVVTLNGSMMGG